MLFKAALMCQVLVKGEHKSKTKIFKDGGFYDIEVTTVYI